MTRVSLSSALDNPGLSVLAQIVPGKRQLVASAREWPRAFWKGNSAFSYGEREGER